MASFSLSPGIFYQNDLTPAFIDFLVNNFWPSHHHDRPPGAFFAVA